MPISPTVVLVADDELPAAQPWAYVTKADAAWLLVKMSCFTPAVLTEALRAVMRLRVGALL